MKEGRTKGLEHYLQSRNYAESTIRINVRYAGVFLDWLEMEGIMAEEAKYSDVMDFTARYRDEYNIKKINTILRAVRYYYKSLKTTSNRPNPAAGIFIKGQVRKQPPVPVAYKKLEELYEWYEGTTAARKRNKVILGLLICQGVTAEELYRMELSHIRLREGKIYITGSKRSNGRTLELHPRQMYDLQEYMMLTRAELMDERGIKETERLFITRCWHIKEILHQLFVPVQKYAPQIRDAGTIRQSVISYWLKSHDVRIVQYMAGHKHVSSTERYDTNRLETLKANISKYHPMG